MTIDTEKISKAGMVRIINYRIWGKMRIVLPQKVCQALEKTFYDSVTESKKQQSVFTPQAALPLFCYQKGFQRVA